MRASLATVAPAAKLAGDSVGGLGNAIKSFARDQRSEARAAGFFVGEIAQIAPVSDAAKVALGGITQALIGGMGVGTAIGLTVTAVQLLTAAWKDEAKASEEAKKQAKETAEAYRTLSEILVRIQTAGTPEGRDRALAENQRRAEQERVKLIQARGEAEEKLARLRKEKAPAELQRDVANQVEALKAAYFASFDLEKAEAARIIREFADKAALKLKEEMRDALVRAHAKDTSGAASAGAFFALEAEYYDPKAIAATAEKVAAEMKRQLAEAHAKDTSGTATVAGFFSLEAEGYDPAAVARAAMKSQEEYNKTVSDSIALQGRWGQSIGEVTGALLTQQITGRQALAQILQMMIKEATAYAIAAAVGGAKSQAPIPVVGPALAISAAGTLLATLIGMIGSMPSARGGWWDTGSYEGLMMIHQREMVLPEREAEAVRRGGRGGLTVNINGAADSRDVRRMLEEELPRVYRRLQRDGAIG